MNKSKFIAWGNDLVEGGIRNAGVVARGQFASAESRP